MKIAGNMINLKDKSSRVPQGSVLGLFSFQFMFYHIASSVGCSWKPFADYFKLHLSFPRSSCTPMLQGMMSLQNDVNKVCAIAKT